MVDSTCLYTELLASVLAEHETTAVDCPFQLQATQFDQEYDFVICSAEAAASVVRWEKTKSETSSSQGRRTIVIVEEDEASIPVNGLETYERYDLVRLLPAMVEPEEPI